MSGATRLSTFLLFCPALLWLGLLIVAPLVDMGALSVSERVSSDEFRYGLANYATFFDEPVYWQTFARTAGFAVIVTAATLFVAFPVALYIAKQARGVGRAALFTLSLLPFWVSELVRTLGWMNLLRESGLISGLLQWLGVTSGRVELLYNDGAMLVGLVYGGLLFMLIPLINALDSLDDHLVEAGLDLGGSRFTVMRRIIIPHAMPGIVAGSIVVFMLTIGNFATAVLLGGKNSLWFTRAIYDQFITRFDWPQGAAFGFMLLGLSSVLVWLGLKLTGQSLTRSLQQS
ncbi:MAG TPA: ABC transporter permease [Aliidongia sp.]|nr:ABC transporter permease [Aliidongia sp.]